ncbi:hypothetical protein SEA_YAGO84_69 [Gordonia phage Yago84]|nr:hypothetical protein SEA_YAGO84_69 [Gordonia phage Yago84]
MNTATITTLCKVQVLASDVLGAVPLTLCCNATGKGSADSPTGVVCRNCYSPVSMHFGDSGYNAVFDAVSEAGCPCAADCAQHTLGEVEAALASPTNRPA